MISEETKTQLQAFKANPARPLVICDVDEVIVHFLSDFDDYTRRRGFTLDRGSHNWGSNISHTQSGTIASTVACTELVEGFFRTRTRHMSTIAGAAESLAAISAHAEVVMLTNLPHWAGDDRRTNLAGHGLTFPVITNSGPKGPAIRHLAENCMANVVFIDDSPHFVESARDHAPEVHIVHFLQDQAAAAAAPAFDFVSLRTHSWRDALPHILALVTGN